MSDLFGGFYTGDTDSDSIPENSYERPADGVYTSEVTDVYPVEGTKNWPDRRWVCVDYTLADSGQTVTEWFGMPAEPAHPSDDERKKLGYYIQRLGDLGVPREKINTVQRESLIGTTVAVTLRSKGEYQNVSRVDLISSQELEPQAGATATPVANQVSAPPGRTGARQRPNPFSGK